MGKADKLGFIQEAADEEDYFWKIQIMVGEKLGAFLFYIFCFQDVRLFNFLIIFFRIFQSDLDQYVPFYGIFVELFSLII